MPALDSLSPGQARSISVKSKSRHTPFAPDHLDITEGCCADPLSEGLERSFFRGEPDREPRHRVARAVRVFPLGFSEQAMRDVGSPRQDSPETIYVHGV